MKFLDEKRWSASVSYHIIVYRYKQTSADGKHMWVVVEQSRQKLLGAHRQWEKEISLLLHCFQTNNLDFKMPHI